MSNNTDETTMTKGFTDRPLTSGDQEWWDLWHEHKKQLRDAGFTIDKAGDTWVLSYDPLKGEQRDDPELEAKRDAAWREHELARARLDEAKAAERRAFMKARKLYTVDEWLEPLVREALSVLGEPKPPFRPRPELRLIIGGGDAA